MCEDYKIMKEMKRERHKKWHQANRAEINKSGIPYTDRGEALLFREKGKIKVDFYPSTGRWKMGIRMVLNGGAKKFLAWYKKSGAA